MNKTQTNAVLPTNLHVYFIFDDFSIGPFNGSARLSYSRQQCGEPFRFTLTLLIRKIFAQCNIIPISSPMLKWYLSFNSCSLCFLMAFSTWTFHHRWTRRRSNKNGHACGDGMHVRGLTASSTCSGVTTTPTPHASSNALTLRGSSGWLFTNSRAATGQEEGKSGSCDSRRDHKDYPDIYCSNSSFDTIHCVSLIWLALFCMLFLLFSLLPRTEIFFSFPPFEQWPFSLYTNPTAPLKNKNSHLVWSVSRQ